MNHYIISCGGVLILILPASESPDIQVAVTDSSFRNAGLFLHEGLPYFSGFPSFPFGYAAIMAGDWVFHVELNSASPMDVIKKMPTKSVMLILGTRLIRSILMR
ncbi:hypothetical protein MH117_03685 [Paenibacillus sp. ACRRX]|uniref:hypothetical protein n=1 Tax=Paenibacillus sp. ACRRX TaxID=2918206 RepID=UPI001EF41267|nr:hypothetical protein [Paenibacillus sp. ACRRX]MCG7406506.1 hypothetical protein [Paenibacillus sp. ACRRX]